MYFVTIAWLLKIETDKPKIQSDWWFVAQINKNHGKTLNY